MDSLGKELPFGISNAKFHLDLTLVGALVFLLGGGLSCLFFGIIVICFHRYVCVCFDINPIV